MVRQAGQGKLRQAGEILRAALGLAVPEGVNHVPDELVEEAVHPPL